MRGRLLLGATLLLAGCGGANHENGSTTTHPSRSESTGSQSVGGWKASTETDAMTDQTVYRARGTVSNPVLTAQTEIICTSARVTYVLTLFDSAGQPADMQISYNRIPAGLRIDDQPPFDLSRGAQVPNRLDFFDLEPKLVTASKLTVRLYTVDGPQTLVIDQTDAKLRTMLNQCATALGEKRAAEKAERDERAADLKARCGDHPCPIEVPTPGTPNYYSMDVPLENSAE